MTYNTKGQIFFLKWCFRKEAALLEGIKQSPHYGVGSSSQFLIPSSNECLNRLKEKGD